MVPLGLQNITIKRGERLRRRAEIFGVKELLIKILKEEKTQGKLVTLLPGILKKPLLHILRFKKNQTLQVLKVGITIQDCNFWACLSLVSRLSERTVTIIKKIQWNTFYWFKDPYNVTLCFVILFFALTLLFWFVVQYKYPCLSIYMYCRKHTMCTTWFLNSLLAAVNQSLVHQTTTI